MLSDGLGYNHSRRGVMGIARSLAAAAEAIAEDVKRDKKVLEAAV